MPDPDDEALIENLMGPHEWGYRDLAEGGLISDGAPYQAADRLTALLAERDRLREMLTNTGMNLRRLSGHLRSHNLIGLATACSDGAEDCEEALTPDQGETT